MKHLPWLQKPVVETVTEAVREVREEQTAFNWVAEPAVAETAQRQSLKRKWPKPWFPSRWLLLPSLLRWLKRRLSAEAAAPVVEAAPVSALTPSGRAPNDPREVRRRKREAERLQKEAELAAAAAPAGCRSLRRLLLKWSRQHLPRLPKSRCRAG